MFVAIMQMEVGWVRLAGLNGELKMKKISGDDREVEGEENTGI